MVISPRVINKENKNRLVPKNQERPAQLNKIAPKHYVYRDKGFAWNKKAYYYVQC